MKVYLSRDEYNNNITPTYFRNDEFAMDDSINATFSEPNHGGLIIQGDAFKIITILEDIAFEKSKNQFRENNKKIHTEEVINKLTNNMAVVFSYQAKEYLATCKLANEKQIYRTICRVVSSAFREGKRVIEEEDLVALNEKGFLIKEE